MRTLTITTPEGVELVAHVAKIVGAPIVLVEGQVVTQLRVDISGTIYDFARVALSAPDGEGVHVGTAHGADYLRRLLEVASVNSWDELPGSMIVALFDLPMTDPEVSLVGFAHILDDRVLIFAEHNERFAPKPVKQPTDRKAPAKPRTRKAATS